MARPAQALAQIRLQRPDPGPQLLERPRLLEALSEHAERPLTVVVAEAGYGKTSLCAAWVRLLRRPVVWYSLTPADADLIVFASTLLAGLRREFPRVGRAFERALDEAKPGARTAEMLAGTLVHELASLRASRALIVLDDFQDVAASAPVSTFVEILLRDLPDPVRVLIASRTPPPVSLERLRARGQVFELHSGHLRFTREELQRLFDEVYQRPISDGELTLLDETTLGWPTAVHLVHESLRRRESTLEEVLSDFRASRLELRDYLSSEVYARLDPESRRLLERTAVLPRFDAGLAGELTGMPRPDTTLDALVRRGLLRAFGSGEHVSYECHELVRAFVRHELEARLGADGLRDLHAEAAAARIGRGDSEAALGHLFAAGHTTQAAAVLCEIGPGLLRQGRAAVVRGWLAELPDDLLRQDLELAVMQADAAQALGDWDEAERRYSDVLERCRVGGSIPGRASPRAIECRALVGLGKVMNLRGRHEQVLGMAERGLAAARDLELEPRVRLMQMKAGAHFYLGQFKGAIDVLAQVRSLLETSREHTELLVPTLHNLAIAHAAQGHYREALEEFRVALAQVRGTDSPRAPLYLSNLAFLHADLGELAEGRRAAEEGLAASQRFSNRAQECVCHQGLAQILAASGDLDGALAALRRAEELNGELRIQVIAADLLATRGRIFCARGEYRRAVEFMEQAIARVGERADAPRKLDFQSALAWCELRAGRPRVARDLLEPLVARADAGENDAQRTHVHYGYAETLLALHEPGKVDPHLGLALRLARERGYLHFLRVQAREEPAPLLHALEKGLEVDTVVAALVEAGPAVESELVEMLEHAPPSVAEAAAAVLGEVGGAPAMEALERMGKHRRSLASAFRTARRHISERVERGRPAAGEAAASRRLALFGPPRLEVNGQAVPPASWRSQRAFQMLVFLALQPRGANKDVLLERFWPGRQLAAGRRNFHPTLSYVRHVLPAQPDVPILREGEVYRLNPEYPLGCDAWEFERALETARAEREPAARREALRQATALATGPFLEGFYSDWADALQARMRDRLEKALLELADLEARGGGFDAALETFRRAATLDEYRESTRIAVIECLVRLGERRGALVEYDRLKTTLRRELSVEPLPETEEAMQSLLRGEGVHGWPSKPPAESTQSKRPQTVERSDQVEVNES